MNFKKVKSSNIQEIGYDAPSQTLHMRFRGGGHYKYLNVTPDAHKALMAAQSHGGHFAAHIRNRHGFEKVST